MNRALLISAAVSMAFSSAALAEKGMRFGASADQYIDSSAQITANDCHGLSVEAARNACLNSAQSSVGGTSSSAGGTAQGGMPSGSNESKPGSSASGGAEVGTTTGSTKSGAKAQGSTKSGAKSQGSYKSQGKKQGNPAGSNESNPGSSAAAGVGASTK